MINVALFAVALAAPLQVATAISNQASMVDRAFNMSQAPAASFMGFLKPPRIFRTGSNTGKDAKERHFGTQTCGETIQIDSKSDKDGRCPKECPFYVQDKTDDLHCSFRCVRAEQCVQYNPKASVADFEKGACRAPMANFCEEYDTTGKDRCAVCKRTYVLDEYGQCHFKYMWVLWLAVLLLVLIVVLLLALVLNMGCRQETNTLGLHDGLTSRSGQKLRMPKRGPGGQRQPWPISTNLTKQQVAGPGMMLHFNFQAVLILWAFGVALLWTAISYVEDPVFDRLPDLMRIGTRRFGMPRENCILVSWGYETQHELMWIKVVFLVVMYVVSFGLSILHSIRQLKLYEAMDEDNTTMTDFAVLLSGLPIYSGNQNPEEVIKKRVEQVTGQHVLGVSLAWDFLDEADYVMTEAKSLVYFRDYTELARPKTAEELVVHDVKYTGLKKTIYDAETHWLAPEPEHEEEIKAEHMRTLLAEMRTTEYAFVVFKTEESRNVAIDTCQGRFGLDKLIVTMEATRAEPDTVQWQNFGHSDFWSIVTRLAMGFGYIFLGLLAWTLCFYGPYAWSIFNFNYENGNEPGFIYGFAFSMVVVIGNAIMYEVCARVSDMVGFHFRDNREACYMILYTIACTFNILMDFVTTYYIVLQISMGLGFRTYHGVKLKEIDDFSEQFESYAMQRLLGENTYTYAFPSTFLIPFLIEPFITIYVPLKAGILIVRSHPEIVGGAAEDYLAPIPMDMGRYADCLLDVVLAVLVLYFPGGWTWRMYFALAFCHMFIYGFDHWKVLRNIPSCTYASMDVDWWSQAMLAPCVAVIASCLVFKANCVGYGFCVKGYSLVFVCAVVWFLHCFVHIAILIHVVPKFGRKVVGADAATNTYEECASTTACNWFTANPVHCLRSKFTLHDEPPCLFFMPGKEHCQQVNPKIGCYFTDTRVEMEDYNDSSSFHELGRTVSTSFHKG